MKKSIYYAIMMVLGLTLPQILAAQANLTGTWRLKESKKFKGPDYTNAVPLVITIEQKPDQINFVITSSNGEQDTVVKESLNYGKKEKHTPMGKKRVISFIKNEEKNSWLKKTEIYTKDDLSKLQSVNKETFTVYDNNNLLNIFREYDSNDDPKGNQDFIVEGVYEKVTPEQLAKETATGKGVSFVENLNWEEIKAKAKLEKKYIFVDCYATWCRPCKMMDRYVYPLNIVGEAMNDHFVAVKVQMDNTKNDQPSVRQFYSLARQLEKEYGINALPSYLFFSPEGTIVHKAIGQQDAKKFIELLANSRKPEQQLYTLINKAKNREYSWIDYPGLIKRLRDVFNEKTLAKEIASIYYSGYIVELEEQDLLKKEYLDFIGEYPSFVKSSDKLFKLSLIQPALVDSIKQYKDGGWAEALVNKTIIKEDVQPFLLKAEQTDKEPNWTKLEQLIAKKIGNELSITSVLDARIGWYEKKKDWQLFLQYVRPQLARHDLKRMSGIYLNRCAWRVFKHSTDTLLMKEALKWTDIVIDKTPNKINWIVEDTKACLLYKMGKKESGITIIKMLLEKFPAFSYSFQPRLDKMLRGEKIWLTF